MSAFLLRLKLEFFAKTMGKSEETQWSKILIFRLNIIEKDLGEKKNTKKKYFKGVQESFSLTLNLSLDMFVPYRPHDISPLPKGTFL